MNKHSFHIPVMGIGFTLDTPLKVAHLGMDSVISLVDDILLEKMRKMYSEKFELPYQEITDKIEDFRAKRITSYLNMIQELAEEKFENLKNLSEIKSQELRDYFSLLPDNSQLKLDFNKLLKNTPTISELGQWLRTNLSMGSIDVNIMTKVDKDNYIKDKKLDVIYNDAHAALRGFAQSNLQSSVILSAGMNPRLYAYMEQFQDFYPDENGQINKKIILKVSDYRSALIQGKFLAKKGLWVSEYRIESGLNCGGHAFATDGFLLGPVLKEFKEKRAELHQTISDMVLNVLATKDKIIPSKELSLKITAQGGVGTHEEHEFLMNEYGVDSVGWGSPFLLVPEATAVDQKTLDLLTASKEEDLYLSNISPLGIPFNSIKGNTKDEEKQRNIDKGRPGSACPKKYISLNNEFGDKGLCTASRQYQHLKIKELEEADLDKVSFSKQYKKITDKSCICVGLGTPSLLINEINTKTEGTGVSVCPGPNIAYFSKTMSLKEITSHIYGKASVLGDKERPNMFVKELGIYLDYLKDQLEDAQTSMNKKQEKYLTNFAKNLQEGVSYYKSIFGNLKDKVNSNKVTILKDLEQKATLLSELKNDIEKAIILHKKEA